jgi:hypothetical protein
MRHACWLLVSAAYKNLGSPKAGAVILCFQSFILILLYADCSLWAWQYSARLSIQRCLIMVEQCDTVVCGGVSYCRTAWRSSHIFLPVCWTQADIASNKQYCDLFSTYSAEMYKLRPFVRCYEPMTSYCHAFSSDQISQTVHTAENSHTQKRTMQRAQRS